MKFYEDGEYRATKDWPYSISAGCIVYRHADADTEVLLLKREPTHSHNITDAPTYNLPKGHISLNEAIGVAAERETNEEAGVKIVTQTYLGTKFWSTVHPVYKMQVQKTVHYFAALWKSDLANMDNEHDEKIWVSLQEALKLLGKPNPKGEDEIVRRLQRFLEISNDV